MSVLWVVLPISLVISGLAVAAFVASVRRGEFDDLDTPARRMLLDEPGVASSPHDEAGQDRGSHGVS